MATKLTVWNDALQELGSERLADTGDPVKAGRELTAVHDQVVAECIAAGSWNFAMETVKIDADTGVTPSFGFTEVFAKPSDWVRTIGVSLDERFSYPLTQYYDDDTFWSADSTPIYVRYVSDDTGLGLDLARWPAQFTRFVALELADRVCMALTQNASLKEQIGDRRDKARKRALNSDSQNEAQPKFLPPGSWTVARWGSSGGGRRDRGSRGSLTG
jgi:hypothetical protein